MDKTDLIQVLTGEGSLTATTLWGNTAENFAVTFGCHSTKAALAIPDDQLHNL